MLGVAVIGLTTLILGIVKIIYAQGDVRKKQTAKILIISSLIATPLLIIGLFIVGVLLISGENPSPSGLGMKPSPE